MFLLTALVCVWMPSLASGRAVWRPLKKLAQVVDVAGQFRNGSMVLDETNRLALLRPNGALAPFAPRYVSSGGDEPYAIMAPTPRRHRCSFGHRTIYVLRLAARSGVLAIDRHGHVHRFATLPVPPSGFESGIAFDDVGHFRYRLLVTVTYGIESALYAIDCRGRVRALARHMPKVEGGMEVAPRGFGRFGGYLIAPDEVSGHVYAIPPNGAAEVLTAPRLPIGGDVGVETAAFVPRGLGRRWTALVADRVTPGNPHPGDGDLLAIPGAHLKREGVRPGDLLVVSEEAARTVDIRCRPRCHSHVVATGPPTAHVEGHVGFMRR